MDRTVVDRDWCLKLWGSHVHNQLCYYDYIPSIQMKTILNHFLAWIRPLEFQETSKLPPSLSFHYKMKYGTLFACIYYISTYNCNLITNQVVQGNLQVIIKVFTCKNLWIVISCNINFKSILKSNNRYHCEISQQPAPSNIRTCSNI